MQKGPGRKLAGAFPLLPRISGLRDQATDFKSLITYSVVQ
jgi:hypothetical protein